jgi:hypothetical protein
MPTLLILLAFGLIAASPLLLYALLVRRLIIRYASLQYFSFLSLHPSLAFHVSLMTIDIRAPRPSLYKVKSPSPFYSYHYNAPCLLFTPYIYFTACWKFRGDPPSHWALVDTLYFVDVISPDFISVHTYRVFVFPLSVVKKKEQLSLLAVSYSSFPIVTSAVPYISTSVTWLLGRVGVG